MTASSAYTPNTVVTIDSIDYMRSYVSELQNGDVTVFGEVVDHVTHFVNKVRVTMTNGRTSVYSSPSATLLVLVFADQDDWLATHVHPTHHTAQLDSAVGPANAASMNRLIDYAADAALAAVLTGRVFSIAL